MIVRLRGDSASGGVRVLDLTRLLPGPMCTLHLADLGADVIKIEDLGVGDYASPPVREMLNRNKRGMRLDLKHPEGVQLLLKLCETADVLVEGFRPGVMARLGLGYDVIQSRNPRLVYCSISGYGQTGPLSQKAGHDLNYCGFAGGDTRLGIGQRILTELPVVGVRNLANVTGPTLGIELFLCLKCVIRLTII